MSTSAAVLCSLRHAREIADYAFRAAPDADKAAALAAYIAADEAYRAAREPASADLCYLPSAKPGA